jgi:hypothetical protein
MQNRRSCQGTSGWQPDRQFAQRRSKYHHPSIWVVAQIQGEIQAAATFFMMQGGEILILHTYEFFPRTSSIRLNPSPGSTMLIVQLVAPNPAHKPALGVLNRPHPGPEPDLPQIAKK